MDDTAIDPAVKFKRRKTTHAKRVRYEVDSQDAVAAPQSPSTIAVAGDEAQVLSDDDTSLTLKEILRNRKRPRDRLREAAARAEVTKAQQALVRREQDAPKQGYEQRFVPQTGQVVDKEEQQITEYIEARLAEKNHRLYGWPIPKHLAATVATLAPDSTQTGLNPPTNSRPVAGTSSQTEMPDNDEGYRLAAGMGKLQEIDLGPGSTSRAEAAWKKLEGGQGGETPAGKARVGRDGKPRRQHKRRNSEDIRRDAMVDEVLREAKLDYFDEVAPSNLAQDSANNEEALVEQFRQEFLDSIETRQQRKPAVPAHGVKEAPKGPKLGGSRSARAAMQAQREQAAKNKR